MRDTTPIAMFTYNRLWHTQKTIDALKKNLGSEQSDLLIFSDAPKRKSEQNAVDAVRKYLRQISGFKSIRIIERKENRGLAGSIISGVTQVVNEYGRVVVLEDDMITSPHFLNYMNDGLKLYQHHPEVACIHGYRYPIGNVDKPFFVRGADCWGWGTWKRAWDNFQKDGSVLLQELKDRKLIYDFNHQGSFPYDKMLKDQILGKNDSWAIRWKASAFLKNQYTLYYNESLLRNIGNDDTGTHSSTTDQFDVDLAADYNGLELQKVEENEIIKERIARFYRSIRPTIWQRLKAKFSGVS